MARKKQPNILEELITGIVILIILSIVGASYSSKSGNSVDFTLILIVGVVISLAAISIFIIRSVAKAPHQSNVGLPESVANNVSNAKEQRELNWKVQRYIYEKLKTGNRTFKLWRAEQFDCQLGQCAYCKKPIMKNRNEVDHVKPLYYGGTTSANNMVLACHFCNTRKGSSIEGTYLRGTKWIPSNKYAQSLNDEYARLYREIFPKFKRHEPPRDTIDLPDDYVNKTGRYEPVRLSPTKRIVANRRRRSSHPTDYYDKEEYLDAREEYLEDRREYLEDKEDYRDEREDDWDDRDDD